MNMSFNWLSIIVYANAYPLNLSRKLKITIIGMAEAQKMQKEIEFLHENVKSEFNSILSSWTRAVKRSTVNGVKYAHDIARPA